MTLTPENEDFEERAAIMEFDGNMTRMEAERLARLVIAEHLKQQLQLCYAKKETGRTGKP